MNQEIVKEWVAALRSGEYPQTRKKLRTEEGYCCLGVLCELAVKHGVIEEPVKQHGFGDEWWFEYYGKGLNLPEVVKNWVGLVSERGDFDGSLHCLSEMNDKGQTFEQIADLIESKPKGLFVEGK